MMLKCKIPIHFEISKNKSVMNVSDKNRPENLYNYINANSTDSYILELLQYEINRRIYYFGDNFRSSWEGLNFNKIKKRHLVERLYRRIYSKKITNFENLVFSNAYFSLNSEIKKLGTKVITPWWTLKKGSLYIQDENFRRIFEYIYDKINTANLQELLSNSFIEKLRLFIEESHSLVKNSNIKAGFFSNDLGFFERLFIDIFERANIPTFVFLHGLPARYNSIDDNRAKYLIVWGEKIKENYINAGVNASKIFVSGHPHYNKTISPKLRFDLDNVLVLSKPANGTPSISNEIILSDRGNCIVYLEMVKKILIINGVTKARLRIHPSESPKWYIENIGGDFFELDKADLTDSLISSSLVIGPTSTVFLETIYNGVNYLVFEPTTNGLDLINYKIVSPFDGTDKRIPVAQNEIELEYILKNRIMVDPSCFTDYIRSPFDLSFVSKHI